MGEPAREAVGKKVFPCVQMPVSGAALLSSLGYQHIEPRSYPEESEVHRRCHTDPLTTACSSSLSKARR